MPISSTPFTMREAFPYLSGLVWALQPLLPQGISAFRLLLHPSQFALQCTECPEKMHPASRHYYITVYIDIIVNNSLGAGAGILNTRDFYGKQTSNPLAEIC